MSYEDFLDNFPGVNLPGVDLEHSMTHRFFPPPAPRPSRASSVWRECLDPALLPLTAPHYTRLSPRTDPQQTPTHRPSGAASVEDVALARTVERDGDLTDTKASLRCRDQGTETDWRRSQGPSGVGSAPAELKVGVVGTRGWCRPVSRQGPKGVESRCLRLGTSVVIREPTAVAGILADYRLRLESEEGRAATAGRSRLYLPRKPEQFAAALVVAAVVLVPCVNACPSHLDLGPVLFPAQSFTIPVVSIGNSRPSVRGCCDHRCRYHPGLEVLISDGGGRTRVSRFVVAKLRTRDVIVGWKCALVSPPSVEHQPNQVCWSTSTDASARWPLAQP
ncbi:hypothetical protein C8R46DRAFT_1223710 [Mycena filopes]|nr:hypothetical protein C8R46DRAFT_1223710 [Mycena filopes]